MNTTAFHQIYRRSALLLACAGFATALSTAGAAESYENYIDFAGGYAKQSGDRPGFQRDQQLNKKGYLGVEDLFYTSALNDTTTLTLKGRALAGNNEFLLDLDITKEDVGYLKLGYQEYRVWFDGTGGFHPATNVLFDLYDEDLNLDRGNFWFEAGYVPADKLNFVVRYDLFTRKGMKDSTGWGDTALAINSSNTRALIPAFYKIDEKRHVASATLSQKREDDKWELGVRVDKGDYTNGRYENRRALEAGQDRKITHKEERDTDLFMVRGSYVNKIHEKMLVTTAVSRTKIDSTIGGSRIVGMGYDAIYDPAFANRQARDEGFFDLHGETEMKQTVGTISAMYQPNEQWSIVPALRMEKIETVSVAEFVETNFTSAKLPDNVEIETVSDKEWKNVSESVEARYKGTNNVSLNFKAEWVQADGELTEELIDEPGTPLQVVAIDRDTEFDRSSQKYSATASWYPAAGTTVAVQYYYKGRENDYRSPRDSTISTADRYPAYITNQDFETNDLNVRLSWRLSAKVRSITRYDIQKSQIYTQDIGNTFGESADMKTRILSQTLAFNPTNSWFIQASYNHVRDDMTTPAVNATGAAAARVAFSKANYTNFSLGTGYALDEGSDLYVDYNQVRNFDNYVDNSGFSAAYGSKARTTQLGVTWFKRLDARTALTLRYAYAESKDAAIRDYADYEAHLVYAKVQYRF